MIGLRPSEAGARQRTVADCTPAVIVVVVGAPGTVGALGVTAFDNAEALLEPALVEVTTRNR